MVKRSRKTPLSKTEWRIMNHCWQLGKSTARQVWERSLEEQERDYQTVKTLLDRIAAKGYLEVEKLGPLCLYTPKVSRRKVQGRAIEEFVDVVLDRALHPLVLHLTDRADLSESDLDALDELLAARRAEATRRKRSPSGKGGKGRAKGR